VQKLLTVQAEKQRVHLSEVSERYNKLYERVKTSMDKVDDMINKFEANVNKLRALALELDDVID
jgi:peptidoglycan hydrolase CwlO-like protein